MSTAPTNPLIPSWSEEDRLHALQSYEILDTPAEEEYDEIAKLAAEVFDVPIALMSLVTEDRQWFKAKVGVEFTETPLSSSICKHTMLESKMLVVPDAMKDARFADNPLVQGEPHVRFYAGVPLRSPEGLPLGTICVLDSQPRECSSKEGHLLESLSRQIMVQLELRRSLKAKTRTEAFLRTKLEELSFMDLAQDAIVVHDLDGKILFWNQGAERTYGWARADVLGRDCRDVLHADNAHFEEATRATLQLATWSGELEFQAKDRRPLAMETRWTLIRNAGGQPKCILSISADVTEQKRIEAQFVSAQRMESLGTIAGGIAHDLNNVLAPIMMAIDLLTAEVSSADGKQILDTLKTSAKRGAEIIRRVLSFPDGPGSEQHEVQEPGVETLPRGKGETILVVDNEESVVAITGQTLEAFGYSVLSATDGAHAVAVYAQHQSRIALVITDMMMPVMDGRATIHALMRIDPKVKIIVTSGLDAKGFPLENGEITLGHFLTKPYTASTLLRAVHSVLES